METMQERLSKLMLENYMRGIHLAKATSVNASTISRILKGNQMPKADTLYKIAQYFNVTMEYLLTGAEPADTDCTSATLSPEEYHLTECFRQMSETDQEDLLLIAEMKAAKKNRNYS